MFSKKQEDLLKNYLLKVSSMYFGSSLEEIRRLTYEYGHKIDVNVPPRWSETGRARKMGLDLFYYVILN